MLTRLLKYKEEHLLFVKDFRVPFDNNLAERSLRLIKSKIKVSGGFRSKSGSESFANIRSIINTAKKQKMNIFETFNKILNGEEISFCN